MTPKKQATQQILSTKFLKNTFILLGNLSLKMRKGRLIDVPKGHFAVYVGKNHSRFVVPASYLKSPAFQHLLELSADEFGFEHRMGLVVPCDETFFRRLIDHLDKES
ncbi:hypothetical protein AMTRI_Chr11g98210 [Amborella trichopoda]|uniref:Uncharacterized protein n=1 Tax=Amborella trichopoda TaxID=13333 RepID=W1PL80_AMBTC|nr:hypothetical protein AMTR_s00017p00021670 [Amborella trichopoda]